MSLSIHTKYMLESKPINISGTEWHLIGDSSAARHTLIVIPELDIAFDAGINIDRKISHIFISHGHIDHTKSLFGFLLDTKDKIQVYCPKAISDRLNKFISASFELTKNTSNPNIPWILTPTIPQTEIFIKIKNFNFKVEIIRCSHTHPTNGYGFIEMRNKLLPAYVVKLASKEITQDDLNRLFASGEKISENIQIPHFCYLGDTDYYVLYENKQCLKFNSDLEKYHTIIIECTFLYETDNDSYKKHMCWVDLKKFVISHPRIQFVLYHFSIKYKYQQIRKFFQIENLPNVYPLIHNWSDE